MTESIMHRVLKRQVLAYLRRTPGKDAVQVGKHFGIAPRVATCICRELVADGLIKYKN